MRGFKIAKCDSLRQKHRDPRYPPIAFTDHGALMAANILHSPHAVAMSVYVTQSTW